MTHRLIVNSDLVLHGFVGDVFFEEGFTSREVMEALTELSGDITIRVNSGGGFAFEGIAIYNALKAHDGQITVSVDALAASAASLIAMAGDEIVMQPGSMMMIHDAAGITEGTADTHRDTAERLDQISDQVSQIYQARTGLSKQRVNELMDAETWMTAEEAVELGFATMSLSPESLTSTAEIMAELHLPAPVALPALPAFDYRTYQNAPERLVTMAIERGWKASDPKAADAAAIAHEENTMSKKTDTGQAAATATEEVVETVTEEAEAVDAVKLAADATMAERKRYNEINRIVMAANLDQSLANSMIEDGVSIEDARTKVIDTLAAKDAPKNGERQSTAVVTHDQVDRLREGATKALMLRAGHEGERNEFSGYSMVELARATLAARNIKVDSPDRKYLVGVAFNPLMAGGMHSTSDFGNILADVASKSMLKGWDEAEETFEAWTARGSNPDFKPTRRVDLNLFPNLSLKEEGAEYEYATIGDRGELVQVATYGRKFAITRETVINDDMSVLTRVPSRMGRAAKRTIGDAVYNILTTNPNLSDGNPLFDSATHSNVTNPGAAPTTAEFDAARVSMGSQTDPDGHASGLNIRPRWVLVPMSLEGAARVVVDSETEIASGQANPKKPNSVRGMVEVISDNRLNAVNDYFFVADPNMHDTIEVTYLDGQSEPFMDQMDVWSVDGTEFKVRIDFGVAALDFRAMHRNDGGS